MGQESEKRSTTNNPRQSNGIVAGPEERYCFKCKERKVLSQLGCGYLTENDNGEKKECCFQCWQKAPRKEKVKYNRRDTVFCTKEYEFRKSHYEKYPTIRRGMW